MQKVNFDRFLLKVVDHNGDIVEAIVEAKNSNEAIVKFVETFDGSQNIKKIEVSLPLLVL